MWEAGYMLDMEMDWHLYSVFLVLFTTQSATKTTRHKSPCNHTVFYALYLPSRPLSINLMPLDCGRQHREAQWYTWRFRSCCEGTMLTSAISCFPWCRWYPRANTQRHTISHSHFSTCVQIIITSKPNGLGFGLWEKSTLRRKQLSVWAK